MKINKIIIIGSLLTIILSLEGCGVYREYKTPDTTPITSEYIKARELGPDTSALGNLLWEDIFTDPVLVELINTGLTNNNSLKNAQINIDVAQAQLQGAKLSFFPSLAFSPNGAGASYAGSSMSWSYTLPLQASWEVDVFGKLLNSKRNAQEAVYQSEAYAQAVRSQLIASIANCYYSIASVKKQIELYQQTSQIWKETVEAMSNMKEAGRTTEAAVVQSRANYYSILGGLTDLEVSLKSLNNTMSLLLNVMPQEWAVSSDASLSAPESIIGGVNMSCLAFRPDVEASERALASAFYATNQARANFYPTLMISAQGGFTNLLGSMISNPGDWFVQLAGSLTAPIFSRGQNIARLKAAKAQQQKALNDFEYSLLNAAKEVENYLVTYTKADEKSKYIAEQVQNLEKSVEYTNDLLVYANGTYLEVLTAQQSLLSAQMSLLANRLTRSQAIIGLYQSLGGGR